MLHIRKTAELRSNKINSAGEVISRSRELRPSV